MRYALIILIVLCVVACDEPQPAQSNEVDVQEIAMSGDATITEVSPGTLQHSSGGETYGSTTYVGPTLFANGNQLGDIKKFKSTTDSSMVLENTADGGTRLTRKAKTETDGGEMKGEGLLARIGRILWNIFVGWLIAVVVAVVLALIPATAPIGALLLKLLVSPIPGVGAAVMAWLGSRKVKAAETQTAQVVAGVQKGRQELQPEERAKLDAQLAAAQDDATKKKVAAIKTEIR